MTWLPKGERPKGEGDFWVREEKPLGDGYVQVSGYRPCLVRNLVGDEWLALWPGDASPHLLTDSYFDHCFFAPAVPPPDWDLVEALEEEITQLTALAREATGVGFDAKIEGLELALDIVRSHLAGEPKP